ncbi:MAG: ABC transporter ATP-binding protein [Rubrobacter sp.]
MKQGTKAGSGGDPVVELSRIVRDYDGMRAVNGLDLAAERGEVLALLGPSGCGKTTTLRVIAGFERPDAGEVVISGRTVASGKAFVPPERRQVGMVFQDYALFPHLNVGRNVAYGLKGSSGTKATARVEEVLALTRLSGLADRMPHELSGGQQQRVALARAVAPGPDVILLDEPFSNLDAALRTQVRREMRAILAEAGATTVFVTHDQEEALSLADRVAVIFSGKVAQVATPEVLYNLPATRQVAAFVGEANFLEASVRDGVARCALGDFPAKGVPDGEAEVMVRPEAVSLMEDPSGGAVVVGSEFFGYGRFVRVKLVSGEVLTCRVPGGSLLAGRVRVSVAGEVVVFPGAGAER